MMIGGELQLPEPIIQHIQSFLNQKDAVRTTVLSKSWHSAWLTLPNLKFNEWDFERYSDRDDGLRFSEYANKIIQRYEESNLRIESLVIYIKIGGPLLINLTSELIVRALKLGATHISCNFLSLVLPPEVFEAENLVKLSLVGGLIDINSIKCPSLKSLRLSGVKIARDTIYNIISGCPLIQKLSVSSLSETRRATRPCAPCPTDIPRLCHLRCLVLCNVEFDTLWCFGDLLPMLTSLHDLTLERCKDVRKVCSPSLERLTFELGQGKPGHRSPKVEFDVPSIKKFTIEGPVIPWVCFKSTSSEYWESHVSIMSYNHLNTSVFLELNQLLTELRQSKIYLSLDFRSRISFDYDFGDFEGLLKPQVENVTVVTEYLPSLSYYAVFDGLFRLCLPRLMTLYLLPESYRGAKKNNDFVCKTLVQGMKGTCSCQSCFMYGLHDVEIVNVEIYDQVVPAWRPLPLESLLDASKGLTEEQKIRFQLKWNL
ncbi:hypothetical protein CASFOL_015820 [Castilleja foliolosa]|uniref:F-box domain-containing protein n=1 Tax=Castilleja foliolosa TaxID=1961234 RepID=A0ABD3DGR7_9LAMI